MEEMKNCCATEETTTTKVEFTQEDIQDNKILAAFSYFFYLVMIPLIANPTSKYVRFHANQGLVLLVFSMVILPILLIIPILGWIVSFFGYIFCFVLTIIGIYNALTGKTNRLPLIGKIDIIK